MPRLIVLRAIPVARAVAGTPPNPRGQGFIGRKQPPPALVKKRGGQLPARADVIEVDHGSRLTPGHRVVPTEFAIRSLRSQGRVDSIISRQALRRYGGQPRPLNTQAARPAPEQTSSGTESPAPEQ